MAAHQRVVAVGLVAFVATLGAARPARLRAATEAWVFPLRVHVPMHGDTNVRDAWIEAQVRSANELYARFDVAFRIHERVPLSDRHTRVETPLEMWELRSLLEPAQIDTFVVRSLDVMDTPVTTALGVCAPSPGAGFVVVVSESDDPVLAHELGHYFGNDHTSDPGNLMSEYSTSGPYALDAAQGARIVAFARRFERAHRPDPLGL